MESIPLLLNTNTHNFRFGANRCPDPGFLRTLIGNVTQSSTRENRTAVGARNSQHVQLTSCIAVVTAIYAQPKGNGAYKYKR